MATQAETTIVYAAGVVQRIALVTFAMVVGRLQLRAVSVRKPRAPVRHAGSRDDRQRAAPGARAHRAPVRRSRHPGRHGRGGRHRARLPHSTSNRRGKLDHGYTNLARGDGGLARVTVETVDGSGRTLWVDHGYPYVMVFTGDIPAVRRRRLAVEPMTWPPNAFRSGEALVTLGPGESHTADWGLSPTIGAGE